MTKKDLVAKLVEEGVFATKVQGEKAINVIFEELSTSLTNGETVDIHGFGKLEVVDRAARTGRNPSTGEAMEIAASKAVKFKAAKALKDLVNA